MKVLVVDDDPGVARGISRFLELEGHQIQIATGGLEALRILESESIDAVVSDLRMPDLDGLALIEQIRDRGEKVPIILISGVGEVEDAVQAIKRGAADFLRKPFEPAELSMRLGKAVEDRTLREAAEYGRTLARTSFFAGESRAVREIRSIIAKVGSTRSTVLLTGESGTGKEVVAKAIHAASEKPEAPFVPVNLGGVPDQLAESELFGYERGAFTGADGRKIGYFEAAGEGTLFLDEIGEIGQSIQVKLLRALQERRLSRLGSTASISWRARLIAASNRDLDREVREGRFREDLFYRLDVVRIHLPPLRDRMEDLPILSGNLVAKISERMGRSAPALSSAALRKLGTHSFPGNVRELENILERSLIFSKSNEIEAEDIELPRRVEKPDKRYDLATGRTLKEIEAEAIRRCLLRWGGNRVKAAEELGIGRRTIFELIDRYGIRVASSRSGTGSPD